MGQTLETKKDIAIRRAMKSGHELIKARGSSVDRADARAQIIAIFGNTASEIEDIEKRIEKRNARRR